jgi:glycosyltransferase involved in cell wall biosynthesis
MSQPATVSVIVRAFNEAADLRRCLDALAGQQLGEATAETVVVDAGSTDGTVAVARDQGAHTVSLPQQQFSFGRALNMGCAAARGAVLVALSAHAVPPDPGWLRRMVAAFADPEVACACGDRYGPDGSRLAAAIRQRAALARERPEWGYSNSAGAIRAQLWRERPFRDDLVACEDKEWALHWLDQGYVCVVDPSLVVQHDHTHDPPSAIYARARREAEAYAAFLDLPAYGLSDLAREWWSDMRWYDSAARARVSHRRAARLLGAYAGRRQAAKRV